MFTAPLADSREMANTGLRSIRPSSNKKRATSQRILNVMSKTSSSALPCLIASTRLVDPVQSSPVQKPRKSPDKAPKKDRKRHRSPKKKNLKKKPEAQKRLGRGPWHKKRLKKKPKPRTGSQQFDLRRASLQSTRPLRSTGRHGGRKLLVALAEKLRHTKTHSRAGTAPPRGTTGPCPSAEAASRRGSVASGHLSCVKLACKNESNTTAKILQ